MKTYTSDRHISEEKIKELQALGVSIKARWASNPSGTRTWAANQFISINSEPEFFNGGIDGFRTKKSVINFVSIQNSNKP
jgi:hypothetical protein